MKCAVLSCMGLGDGLISLVLSHNLHLNGSRPVTFHPFLVNLQTWFPHLPITPFPAEDRYSEVFGEYEKIYLFYERSPWMQAILSLCQEKFPEKLVVLNPIATPNCDYPYWENGRFDGNLPFAENLFRFCKEVLHLEKTTRENGIEPPADAVMRCHPKRVVIHPTSSRPGKNWPKEKFLALALELKNQGYEPHFILTETEKKEWQEIESPTFATLSDLARFVYESGYMIGNDSGIGHLASCLGLPTLVICRNHLGARFWRPAWTEGKILFPSPLIPNIKFLRWRDRHWKRWISLSRVLSSFSSLAKKPN